MSESKELKLGLDTLRLRDQFIIKKCVIQCLSPQFNYNNCYLDGLKSESGIGAFARRCDTVPPPEERGRL